MSKKNRPEITDAALDAGALKQRITTYIDFDVLCEVKEQAAAAKIGYQTHLNMLLRQAIRFPDLKSRVDQIESQQKFLLARIEHYGEQTVKPARKKKRKSS